MYETEKMNSGRTRQSIVKAVKEYEKKQRLQERKNRKIQRRRELRDELAPHIRKVVWDKHGRVCYLCGKDGADTIDHVIPLIKGGTNDTSNLRPAHLKCNYEKGNKIVVLPIELESTGW